MGGKTKQVRLVSITKAMPLIQALEIISNSFHDEYCSLNIGEESPRFCDCHRGIAKEALTKYLE